MRWPPAARGPVAAAAGPALFLDRDGVLLVDRHYLAEPEQVELIPGAGEALCRAREAGLRLVGVSNQSGLGRDRITAAQFTAVMERFDALLAGAGCPLDAFFYCPHAPEAGCRCRKPAPGLLEEAAAVVPFTAAGSWLVGDKLSDVDLALAAGLRPILVRTGYGAEQERGLGDRAGVLVRDDLPAAVEAILAEVSP